jgi:effector-binding domain-containing protein
MASSEPELVRTDLVSTAVVRGVVPVDGLREFFDVSFTALARTTAEQHVVLLGPAFALYRGPFGDTVDLEVGFPVDRPVQPEGDVGPSSLPAGRVARVTHSGSFDGLVESWMRLADWLRAQGHSPSDQRWESYVTQPSPEMDPRDLRTELSWLVDESEGVSPR